MNACYLALWRCRAWIGRFLDALPGGILASGFPAILCPIFGRTIPEYL
jgi:hypothetical protein